MKTEKTVVKTKPKNGKITSLKPQDINEAIRLKAYELYLKRNGNGGSHTDDWITAERMVLRKIS